MGNHDSDLTSSDLSRRFDLLATDAKEYAIFLMDPAGRLICWNVGAEHLFGCQSPEIIGQHLSRFFTSEGIIAGEPESARGWLRRKQ